ncbi:MAG: cupredoxin domain-containing protein [Nanoarchaeota archaeon]|nr:cupredoxin domain-containing protein [Nanoarchaeota archaeon]
MKNLLLIISLLFFFSACTTIDENVELSISQENLIEVSIRDSQFNPNDIVIEKGTTVKWTNYDSQGHTVTIENLFDSKTITKGKSFSYTFNEVGEFEYECKIHQDIKGVIIVQ